MVYSPRDVRRTQNQLNAGHGYAVVKPYVIAKVPPSHADVVTCTINEGIQDEPAYPPLIAPGLASESRDSSAVAGVHHHPEKSQPTPIAITRSAQALSCTCRRF